MGLSIFLKKPEIASKVLPAGEKSVHAGGTLCYNIAVKGSVSQFL